MLFFIFLIFIGYLIFYIVSNKIHIDFASFFKKGFKKIDNKFGLICYVGKQGKGKTYSAVDFCLDHMKEGYTVITNVYSFYLKNIKSSIIYFSDISDIISYVKENYTEDSKYLIFFDEIFTILEKKASVNKNILSFISQLRKRKILFVTTAQEWSEINITFRRYCRFQVDCNMFSMPILNTAFLFNSINDGDLIKWNEQEQEFVAPRVSANFSKCSLDIINSYDTFETISN